MPVNVTEDTDSRTVGIDSLHEKIKVLQIFVVSMCILSYSKKPCLVLYTVLISITDVGIISNCNSADINSTNHVTFLQM